VLSKLADPRSDLDTRLAAAVHTVTLAPSQAEIGERFAPHRLLPMHDWHMAHGALMHDFGEWQRPSLTCVRARAAIRRHDEKPWPFGPRPSV